MGARTWRHHLREVAGHWVRTVRGAVAWAAHWPRRRMAIVALFGAVLALLVAVLVIDGSHSESNTALPELPPEPTREGFVSRAGTQLLIDGAPYRFTGYNNYVMLGCGFEEERVEGAAREKFFAGLRPNSVVRLGVYPGTELERFDEVVASAREHGQRLIPIFTDAHGYCGDTKKNDDWYAEGFRKEYLDWVRTVVPRYRDDPTIAMWELINEPHGSDTAILRAFFDEAGTLVHELDPNHLVGSGTLQPDTYGGVAEFEELSASPGVDVLSLHEYDDVADASHHLEPAVEVALAVDKPLLVGEWGLNAGPPGASDEDGVGCHTVEERHQVARRKLAAYLDTPVVAGALYWSYTAEDGSICKLSTTRGDPLVQLVRNIPIPLADQ